MKGPPSTPVAVLQEALLHVCERVIQQRGELSRLDAVAGDGDLGESLATGFTALAERLQSGGPLADVGQLLALAGTVLSREAPSTFGTLLGLGLRDAARVTRENPEFSPAGVIQVLDTLADGVARRGQVVAGQRTVLDAIVAARDAAAACAQDPAAGTPAVLGAAAQGACRGAEATAHMLPQVGRAGWIGERAAGHADAGATAFAVLVTALHEGIVAG
jgi:dihydroxyacetone kinase-like protein